MWNYFLSSESSQICPVFNVFGLVRCFHMIRWRAIYCQSGNTPWSNGVTPPPHKISLGHSLICFQCFTQEKKKNQCLLNFLPKSMSFWLSLQKQEFIWNLRSYMAQNAFMGWMIESNGLHWFSCSTKCHRTPSPFVKLSPIDWKTINMGQWQIVQATLSHKLSVFTHKDLHIVFHPHLIR